MDLSELLYVLNLPVELLKGLEGVKLREKNAFWPLISAAEGISEIGKAGIFDRAAIHALEKKLGIRFEETMPEGNVCFANSDEVRPDFRTTFSAADLLNYCFAHFPSSSKVEGVEVIIPFPKDPDHFWKCVGEGQTKKLPR